MNKENKQETTQKISNHKRKRTGGGELLKTRNEMARLCGFSKRTLDRLVSDRVIPVIRVNRLVFFEPQRVMEALQRNLEVKEVRTR